MHTQIKYYQTKQRIIGSQLENKNDLLFSKWLEYVNTYTAQKKLDVTYIPANYRIGMLFNEQPTRRHEQILIIREKLSKRFEVINLTSPGTKTKEDFISNNIWRFIREDNSVYGFKTRCTIST
jgi:hypothetical protein